MATPINVVIRLDSSDFDRGINNARGSIRGLTGDINGIASALGIAFGTRELIDYVNQWQNMQNRIRAVFETTQEQVTAFNDIKRIAGETRSSLGDIADLYTKLAIGGDQLGLTQKEIAAATETFTKALKASGAGAQQAQAAILQFGQAMASGKLQGDEFRSLMENAPVFMRAFADAVGVKSVGELRKLATEGALTSEVVLAATMEMADGIDAKFAKTNQTIGDLLTQTQNTILETFGKLEEETGILNTVFTFVGKNIIAIIGGITAAMVLSFGASMIRNITAIIGAIGALVKIFKTLRAAIATAAAAQGFMIGMTGAGLALIAASGAAAAAAYYGMTKLFEQSDEAAAKQDNTVQELTESLRQQNEQTRLSAKDALAAGKAKVQAEKDAKKAAQEAAAEARRIAKERQRDLERSRDQIIDIKENIRAGKEQATLDLRRLRMSNEEANIQQTILDIEKDRRRQLAEVGKLERLTPKERADQEAEINKLYDDRLASAKEIAMENVKATFTRSTKEEVNAINAATYAYTQSFDDRTKILNTFNDFERRILEEQLQAQIQSRTRLNEELFKHNQLMAEYEAAGDKEAMAREEELFKLRYNQISAITQATKDGIAERINAERQFAEAQMTFAQGWAQAYGQYFENLRVTVTDQASYAKRIFNTITDGFTNSIMRFVETGKLSFKDLFKSLMLEIIKMQVNKLFLSIFGKGGPLGSLFAGMFAEGGMIPAGKYGIAGERGPELIRGPANVVSTKDTAAILGGSAPAPSITQVTYNINAVDSMSFKQMLARDPEFLFNATRVGARRVPR